MLYNLATFTALLEALRLTSGLQAGASFITVKNPTPDPVSTSRAVVFTSLPIRHAPLDGRFMREDSCYVEPYATSPVIETFGPFDQDTATMMRYRRQQSVNLGSWFVNENWMTPSLFRCASGTGLSELDIASGWGSIDGARSLLERHWDTFINRSDFKYLASIGINTVRLPIGYWNLGPYYCQDTPFDAVGEVYRNSWAGVVRAINMAAEVGIGVLIDLHGAIGSQNGQPHSGISDGTTNLFKSPLNVNKTLTVLQYLVQQFAYVTNVVGIEVLNEPENVPELIDFYSQAITVMRQSSPGASELPIYVHNGFDPGRFDDFVASRQDFVVQDHHSYFVFTPSDDAESASRHTNDIHGYISANMDRASKKQHGNLVIDEWSCALTPNSIANESNPVQARKDFCTGQMDVYSNTTAGWSFWSYVKEQCDGDVDWCFKAAVGTSLPRTFFSYRDRPTDESKLQSVRDTIESAAPPSVSDVLAKFPQAATARSLLSGRQCAPPSDPLLRRHDLRHRFEAIRFRRGRQDGFKQWDWTTQQSILKGYYDGLSTGKTFAIKGNWSKLGFVGQYLIYRIATLGPSVIVPGTEDDYRRAFVKGLRDVEENIDSALQTA